jgi:hypothetical protein
MARMIPDVNPMTIENEGERCFYTIAMQLPADYTVLHSYKYGEEHEEDRQPDIIREIDFIVVHPAMGFVTIEVKQGDVMYLDGAFHELKDRGRYQPMKKDPLKQASDAMYGVLHQYQEKSGERVFPLKIKYALCFPDSVRLSGNLPDSLKEESLLLGPHLESAEALEEAFWLETFHRNAEKVLTEEQGRILEETEYDRRKIFLGGAGTGKTFLAMEKARMMAADVYVGSSRARFMLYVFHREDWWV